MKNMMTDLWDQVQKSPDGTAVWFTDEDIEFLWHCGFVDTQQVPFSQWAAFFLPFLDKASKVYSLSKSQFMMIEDFRYKGPIREPFDYHKINEGLYTDQGLEDLFALGVGPSVEAPAAEIATFVDQLKQEFREKDRLIRVNNLGKEKIGQWMDAHPSPLRRLELIMESRASGKGLDPKLFQYQVSGNDAVAAMQASAFSMRPGTVAVSKKEALGKVTQTKAKKSKSDAADTTPLHKIRRSPRGTRG